MFSQHKKSYPCEVMDVLTNRIWQSFTTYTYIESSSIYFKQCVCQLLSCVQLFATSWTAAHQSPLVQGNSPGKNTGVSYHALLQGIFPTQGLNPGLLHCRRILYQLSHQGTQRILEWVAYPFSRGSSRPRNRTGISCIAGRFFIS